MDAIFFPPGYTITHHQCGADHHTLQLEHKIIGADCPDCKVTSHYLHGVYWRHPQDLISSERPIKLWIRVKRFRCENQACSRRTFAQSFPEFLSYKAQRTERFKRMQARVGLQLGGELGQKVLRELNLNSSGDTLLRATRTLDPAPTPPPRVIGVDDWAFRKGHTYGTIIVDLERRRVLDLLADRTAPTLKAWLEKHPSIEIVARDRASEYSRAISSALPQVQQVADRFHLLLNVSQAVHTWLRRDKKKILAALESFSPSPLTASQTDSLKPQASPERRLRPYHRDREARRKQYDAVVALRKEGVNQAQIARETGVPYRTVRWWLQKGYFPERLGRTRALEPVVTEHLTRRWLEGESSLSSLVREVTDLGYDLQESTIRTFLHGLQIQKSGAYQRDKKSYARGGLLYPTIQLTRWLTMPAKDLSDEGKAVLEHLAKALPDLQTNYRLVQRFRKMIAQPGLEQQAPFRTWLKEFRSALAPELVRLAKSFQRDQAAVEAAVTLPWSNGQTEGWVGKLKLIKRLHYGRASFSLLRRHLLMS